MQHPSDGETMLVVESDSPGMDQRAAVNVALPRRWHAIGTEPWQPSRAIRACETRFTGANGEPTWAGELDSVSAGARLDFIVLDQPTPASAVVTIGQTDDAPWTLRLDVAEFAAQQVMPDSSLGRLAFDLEASGNRTQGSASGHFAIDNHRLALESLRYNLDDALVTIETLHLSSPDYAGALNIDGTLDLSGEAAEAHLKAAWTGVELPPDLVGQAMTSLGELTIDGRADAYTAKGSLMLGPADAQASIDVDIAGTAESVALNTIRLVQPSGGLEASGTLTLQPAFAWQIDATARKLDPARSSGWPCCRFQLNTTAADADVRSRLQLDKVGGRLRDKPLSGSADLRMRPGYLVDGALELQSGGSRLAIEGSSGTRTDARVRIDVPALGDWLPASGGSMNGQFQISGQWPQLDIDGDLSGREIAWSGMRAASLELVGKVKNIQTPAGALTLKVGNLTRGDVHFETLLLQGEGNAASHKISLVAMGTPASVTMGLTGASINGRWSGQLTALGLDPVGRGVPDFALDKPARMSWDGAQFVLDESCLIGKASARAAVAENEGATPTTERQAQTQTIEADATASPAILCAAGNSHVDGRIAARYRVEHLPLRLLLRMAAPRFAVRMRANHGSGDGSSGFRRWRAREPALDEVAFDSDSTTPLLSYTAFAIETSLDGRTSNTKIHADLDHDGLLDGNLRLTQNATGSPAIEGNLDVDLNSLAFLELLSSEIAGATGKLTARYGFAGTLGEPRLRGALNLRDFATDVPSAGLKLSKGTSLRAVDAALRTRRIDCFRQWPARDFRHGRHRPRVSDEGYPEGCGLPCRGHSRSARGAESGPDHRAQGRRLAGQRRRTRSVGRCRSRQIAGRRRQCNFTRCGHRRCRATRAGPTDANRRPRDGNARRRCEARWLWLRWHPQWQPARHRASRSCHHRQRHPECGGHLQGLRSGPQDRNRSRAVCRYRNRQPRHRYPCRARDPC